MRTYTIYIIKNTKNDKVYIGQTCQSLHERFLRHTRDSTLKKRSKYKLYSAINKYGKDCFYIEPLETGLTSDEADCQEVHYIEKYNSYENGYNSTRGADKKTISKVDDVDLLLKLYKSKMYYKDIAKVFGVNKETIVRALASLNVGKRRMKITKEYLLENISKTNKQIAKELNVDDETVSRAFKRYSIKRGKGCNNMLNPQNQKGYRSRLMNTEI